jgi:hypothetical protein
MAMNDTLQPEYNMKGKSRHLFWVMLAWILIDLTAQLYFPVFRYQLYDSHGFNIAFGVCLVFQAVLLAGWAAMYALYAAKSSVKTFRVVFILLACGMAIFLAANALSNYGYLTGLSGNFRSAGFALASVVGGFLVILANMLFAACLLVIGFSKKAGAPLKVSAFLLALYYLYQSLYAVLYSALATYLISSMGSKDFTALNMVLSIVTTAVFLGFRTFFFASMSFSKKKQPKAAAISAGDSPIVSSNQ